MNIKLWFNWRVFVCTIFPFVIPILMDNIGDYMEDWVKGIIYAIFVIADVIGICYFNKKNIKSEKTVWEKTASMYAYSEIYEVNETKRNYLMDKSYKDVGFSLPKDKIPYDVFTYIQEICKSFAGVIAKITDIRKENISVSFVYRYVYENSSPEDEKWRWVIGRELTMNTPLDDYIDNRETVYYQLVSSNTTALYCNEKKLWAENGKYFMSSRDKRHNKVGSFFAAKVMFSNNANKFTEGIIMVSTYGKRFVEKENAHTSDQLKQLIIDNIFPCYQRMLETELGILYFQHEKETKEEL